MAACGTVCKCFSFASVGTMFEPLLRQSCGAVCKCFSSVELGTVLCKCLSSASVGTVFELL